MLRRNHYIPIFVLKNFASRLELKITSESIEKVKTKAGRHSILVYNLKSAELTKKRVEKAFCKENLYTDEIEDLLTQKMESQFSDVLREVIRQGDVKKLTPEKLLLLKKYCALTIIRTCDCDEFSSSRGFYDVTEEKINRNFFELERLHGRGSVKKDFLRVILEQRIPFEEYKNCTNKEYWEQTMKVFLETNGAPIDIKKHNNPTHEAYRLSKVIEGGFLTFWESAEKVEFVITDIGMTSENDKEWNEIHFSNRVKKRFLQEEITDKKIYFSGEKNPYYDELCEQIDFFHENFMLFPISNNLILTLVCPYFKHYFQSEYLQKIDNHLTSISSITDINIFQPSPDGINYFVKKLNRKDSLYCNRLLLDRISENVGFNSLTSIATSVLKYHKETNNSMFARVKYTKLLEIIRNVDKNF